VNQRQLMQPPRVVVIESKCHHSKNPCQAGSAQSGGSTCIQHDIELLGLLADAAVAKPSAKSNSKLHMGDDGIGKAHRGGTATLVDRSAEGDHKGRPRGIRGWGNPVDKMRESFQISVIGEGLRAKPGSGAGGGCCPTNESTSAGVGGGGAEEAVAEGEAEELGVGDARRQRAAVGGFGM
jgi:hypothetical protein